MPNFHIEYKDQFLHHSLLLFVLNFILKIHSWYVVVQQGELEFRWKYLFCVGWRNEATRRDEIWVNNGSLFKKLVPDIRVLITDDQYARWLLM